MANKIVIVATHGKDDPERATMAFHVARVSTAADQETLIFLMVEGAWLAAKDYADEIQLPGFAPLKELMESFLASGGQLRVCGTCATARGLAQADLIEGAVIASAIDLVQIMASGASVLSL
jgi:predicted peroxiredoxin